MTGEEDGHVEEEVGEMVKDESKDGTRVGVEGMADEGI